MNKKGKVAVLVSGTGSLLEALLDADVPVALVMADRDCRGVDEVAMQAGIPTIKIPRKDFTQTGRKADQKRVTKLVLAQLKDHGIDWVIMAGWMTVFSAEMFAEDAYGGKITNNHPALLPSFKGDNAVQDALDYGVKVTGCTIHIATEELDAGPILAQAAVRVEPGDTKETLHERIKEVERVLLVQVVNELIAA